MALSPGIRGRAGPLCSHILDLRVAEHRPDAGVVTVGGEIDTLTAPPRDGAAGRCPPRGAEPRRGAIPGAAGPSVLVEATTSLPGARLRLVCHSGMVNRALGVISLRKQFGFAGTVSAAWNNSPKRSASRSAVVTGESIRRLCASSHANSTSGLVR